jgi:hypothetical protein
MIHGPTIAINFITPNYVFLFVPATYLSCVANFPREIYTLFLLTYLFTYATEKSHSGEANRFSASQEIPAFYATRSFITVSQAPATCPHLEPDPSSQ